ncbi:MAG TPA: hypothetical protein VM865_00485 [Acidobacteriaceae bacterium]|jgi:hypothetical protein|nr:hypothetical protein [Acidobacteriaceae bacterium]
MALEQQPPNGPNFRLILYLFLATILVVFVLAYFLLDWDAGGLLPKGKHRHPTSQLVLPFAPAADALATGA